MYPSDAPPEPAEDEPESESSEDAPEGAPESTDELNVEELLKDLPEDQPEGTEDVDTSEFDKQFAKRFGVTPDEAAELVTELREFKSQLHIQQQQLDLAQAWGISFSEVGTRLQAVKKAWDKLPPDAQEKLDNPEGAKTIWAYLEGKKAANPVQGKKTQGTSSKRSFDFTKSEISRMSDKEYQANIQAITDAFNRGRVDLTK